MSSKLHRHGSSASADAVIWEPLSKHGASPSRGTREVAGRGSQESGEGSPARAGDLERQMNERAQAAYQRGFAEGEARGREQAAAQVQPGLERLARTLEEIAKLKPRLRHEAEGDVVKLAMAIARRILYRELATDPDALLGLVRAALDKLDGREVHRIRANPQDAAVVQQHFQKMAMPRTTEILADPGLERGSAIFETANGSLDASVDTQLNEIERGFADLVKRPVA
jgi:flagellar assembly protein FliH